MLVDYLLTDSFVGDPTDAFFAHLELALERLATMGIDNLTAVLTV